MLVAVYQVGHICRQHVGPTRNYLLARNALVLKCYTSYQVLHVFGTLCSHTHWPSSFVLCWRMFPSVYRSTVSSTARGQPLRGHVNVATTCAQIARQRSMGFMMLSLCLPSSLRARISRIVSGGKRIEECTLPEPHAVLGRILLDV